MDEVTSTQDVSGAIYIVDSTGEISGNTFYENVSPGRATVVIHDSWGTLVERNIFAGDTAGYGLQYLDCSGVHSCNLYWSNANGPIDNDELGDDEIIADPMFCNPDEDEFGLYDISPAAPANNPCGELIGAYPVMCTTTSVLSTSWGGIKSLY